MLDRSYKKDPYTLVMLTLDAHSIGSVERIKSRFSKIYPELEIVVHAAASWEEDPSSLLKTKGGSCKCKYGSYHFSFFGGPYFSNPSRFEKSQGKV